ncbi:hypothetical protein COTS27_00138 [Spirochaetota bacterium]|nr:hypothetical protein COTS27_00138 [Spirochaetota bacterium]
MTTKLLTIREASTWASQYLKKNVTTSNIAYLIQYGKIKKYGESGNTVINKHDLITYYKSFNSRRELNWKEQLGTDLNWALSFEHLKEKETTKHVHRLHPYKGKFIPQLAEYFLDDHTDTFKRESYFKKGDIVLDPFCGSGTTMVQANELGIHALGVDISTFNTLIANVKVGTVDFEALNYHLTAITQALKDFIARHNNTDFENALLAELNQFNKKYFPAPEYKIKARRGEIKEHIYAATKEKEFTKTFDQLRKKYNLQIHSNKTTNFLEKWYLQPVKKEIDFTCEQVKRIKSPAVKKIIAIILSRTVRSCRATTHADLATLKNPVIHPYYCRKHGKICKPLFSILAWWQRYCDDTIKRLYEFNALRTDTFQTCLQGDARNIDLKTKLGKKIAPFAQLIERQKIKGIFSSPPYIGLIDYHEQHAYAYDLFGFPRNDSLEIGPLAKGQGRAARQSYIESIAKVLVHAKKYLLKDYDVFLVANDKYNLYPTIAEKSAMKIVHCYKRPVLNRTEKDKSAYAEIIFHLKEA